MKTSKQLKPGECQNGIPVIRMTYRREYKTFVTLEQYTASLHYLKYCLVRKRLDYLDEKLTYSMLKVQVHSMAIS